MLNYCPSRGIYGQMIAGDLRVESGYLRSAPRGHVSILSQEDFELLLCQVRKSCSNLHSFVWVIAEDNDFKIFIWNGTHRMERLPVILWSSIPLFYFFILQVVLGEASVRSTEPT